jgi:pimeloyl-ACP methyl ester carboxylesterase
LVISGGKDPTFTVEMGDELAAMFINRTHLHLKNAGHLVMAEFAELVNMAIGNWVKQLATDVTDVTDGLLSINDCFKAP